MVIITKNTLPIKIWTDKAELVGYSDAIDQASNLANHPLTRHHVCLMPDFHVGYGMPIGGVIATQGGVIPNAVGVDIGCGMIATQTDLDAKDLTREMLEQIRLEIHKRIPVGMNHHKEKQKNPWLTEANAIKEGVSDDPVIKAQLDKADYQIGSLGGGNHFIEVQKDQDGKMWIMIHSGSRNLGKQICDHYHLIARKYMETFHSAIPHRDLSFLPEGVPEMAEYIRAMRFAMGFAEASRKSMYKNVEIAFQAMGVTFGIEKQFDTHHNFAALEHHFGQNMWIHRKGAVQAKGLVTIPGSMGTASYIGEGLMNPDSFHSCSHGAGRVLGRAEANRTITHTEAVESVKHVVFGVKQGDYDEMPAAYKDIEKVMTNQADLVKPVYKLLPLMVAKG